MSTQEFEIGKLIELARHKNMSLPPLVLLPWTRLKGLQFLKN